MVSGGVASPYDPLDSLPVLDRTRSGAAVEEAAAFKRYVCAHAYPANAIARAVECGVRVIEHGNLHRRVHGQAHGQEEAFLVPTLVAYDAISQPPPPNSAWARRASRRTRSSWRPASARSELAKRAGVRMAFGSDLLGQLQPDQSKEFLLRGEALSPREIIHSATIVGAELLGRVGELGVIAPGALADLLVVDGNHV